MLCRNACAISKANEVEVFYGIFERAITMKLRKNVIELSRKWLYMKILLQQFSDGGKSSANLYVQRSRSFSSTQSAL